VGPHPQRLCEVDSHRGHEWEHRVTVSLQDVCRDGRAAILAVVHRAYAMHPLRVDHERRVRREEHLVLGSQSLVKEAQEVCLRLCVKTQAWLIEQEDQGTARLLLDLGEVGEEREEPYEAARALIERDR